MQPKNLIFIVLDSCRFDSYQRARTPNMDRLGAGERRFSYASWTSPSHYTYLMGMIPHTSPAGVFASEVYKSDFVKWVDRLGIDGLSFKSFVPQLSLPGVLQQQGYRTCARVSMPVLNPSSHLNRHFDDYRLMANHSDFAGMLKDIEFDEDEPQFYFLNLGETHYPYMLDPASLPHISGVHGVFKHLDDLIPRSGHRAVGEERAWGRRLAKRFGVEPAGAASLSEALLVGSPVTLRSIDTVRSRIAGTCTFVSSKRNARTMCACSTGVWLR